jgi:S1-C subfamily serine protease
VITRYASFVRRSLVPSVGVLLLTVAAGCNLSWLSDATPATAPTQTPYVIVVTPTPLPAGATNAASASGAVDVEEQLVTSVYEQRAASVVNVTSRTITYDFFFRAIPQEGTGSGFVFDAAGHIVTNYHVVEGAEEVEVTLADDTVERADIVGVDPQNDLAVLYIEAPTEALKPIPLGSADDLRVGQRVIAIGNPFGRFERTLTSGVISAMGRIIENDAFLGEVIQTDAAINPGNSGGPLLNSHGRLVGVNTAIFSPSGTSAGIGFAIPVSTVRRVVPVLIAEGRYRHPWLGIRGFDITPDVSARLRSGGLDLGVERGVLVVTLYQNSPALAAGIRPGDRRVRLGNLILPVGGDIVTAVDGTPVTEERDLTVYLEENTQVGQTVELTIVRDGRELTVPVTLAEAPTRS